MKTLSRILTIMALGVLVFLGGQCGGAPVPHARAAEKPTVPKPPPEQTNTNGTCLTVVGHFGQSGFPLGYPAYWLPDFSVNNAQGPIGIMGGSAIMVTNPNLYGFTIGYIHTSNWRFAANYHITSYPYSLAMVPASDVGGFPYACTQNNLVPAQATPITNQVASCAHNEVQNPYLTYQLTQFSVNTGVLGPNVYIWQHAEILITNYNYYGFLIGYINTNGSAVTGPFVAGGNNYVSLAQFQPNILIMIPVGMTGNYTTCWNPPSPVPYVH